MCSEHWQISKRLHEPYNLFVTSGFWNMINLNYTTANYRQKWLRSQSATSNGKRQRKTYLTVWIEGVHEMQQRKDHSTTNCITLLFFSRENFNIYIYGREGTETWFADKPLALTFVVTMWINESSNVRGRAGQEHKCVSLPKRVSTVILKVLSRVMFWSSSCVPVDCVDGEFHCFHNAQSR